MSGASKVPDNAFETVVRKVIPATLIYVRNEAGELLMLHRVAESRASTDYHHGLWNGLGGKLEPEEAPVEAAARELAEESGIAWGPDRFQVLGVLHFPNFKPHRNEDWIAYVLVADWSREAGDAAPWSEGPEGQLSWVAAAQVLELPTWPGDREFLPWVIRRRPFVGTLWYDGRKLKRAAMQELGG